MAEEHDLRREIDEFGRLRPRVVAALSEAAHDDGAWAEAAADVRKYLAERGLELADWVDIQLYQTLPPTAPHELRGCGEGNVLVGAPGRTVCTRWVKHCVQKPHMARPFCYELYCVKWETLPWVGVECVPISDFMNRF